MSEVPLHLVEVKMFKGGSACAMCAYRGTSLIRNTPPVGPYSSPMPRDLW